MVRSRSVRLNRPLRWAVSLGTLKAPLILNEHLEAELSRAIMRLLPPRWPLAMVLVAVTIVGVVALRGATLHQMAQFRHS
jgi:hypothetical protein